VTESTADRILDAAESLFAEGGFEGTSLRTITAAAGVNLAAVAYHFGSKDGLVEAVFTRRFEPVNRERFERLAALGARPTVEGILEAFLLPALRLARDARVGPLGMRLLGRTYAEPSPLLRRIFGTQFREVALRFRQALHAALPHLSAEVVLWRLHFCVGAMAHVMADGFRLAELSDGRCDTAHGDEALRQLVPFLAAGLRAPSAAGGTP